MVFINNSCCATVCLLTVVSLAIASCSSGGSSGNMISDMPAASFPEDGPGTTAGTQPAGSDNQPDTTTGDTGGTVVAPESGNGSAQQSPDSNVPQNSSDFDLSPPEPPFTPQVDGPVTCNGSGDDFKNRMLQQINQARAVPRMCGADSQAAVKPVVWNEQLQQAAFVHSADMASVNFLSHTSSDGRNVVNRVNEQDLDTGTVAENVAAGRNEIQLTVTDWLESEGHCKNIMRGTYTDIGAACVSDTASDYTYYWTLVFARP